VTLHEIWKLKLKKTLEKRGGALPPRGLLEKGEIIVYLILFHPFSGTICD